MIQIAKKPMWWLALFLLMFLPFVGPIAAIVVGALVWMAIAEQLGKPNWWGILAVVPIVGIIVPGYLAFSDSDPAPKEPVDAGNTPAAPASTPAPEASAGDDSGDSDGE